MCELALLANFFIDLELRPKITEHGLSYNNFQAQNFSYGSRAAVAGRQMAQPVYTQLRKYPLCSGTDVSCQKRPRVVPQTGAVLAKLDSARYRQLQHQELGRRPAPTCSPSKVALSLQEKMWPVRQLNGTSHHGVMRSSLRRRGRE